MNDNQPTSDTVGYARFDALRALIEVDLARPATVVITSSTSEDGKEIAARGLSSSLAIAGYRTVLIDTSTVARSRSGNGTLLSLEEIARQHVAGETAAVSGMPAFLGLDDQSLRRTVSKRSLQAALDTFRDFYDFVVFSTEFDTSSPFATGILASADAVVATVRTGRRSKPADQRLALSLGRIGARFLGVIALEAAVIREDNRPFIFKISSDSPRSAVGPVDGEQQRRKPLESPA